MRAFYNTLLQDDAMAYIFNDVAQIDLEAHLPHIVSFWEGVVFNTGDYRNNVMQLHLNLNAKAPLSKERFETWLEVFYGSVDCHFEGSNAEKIKTRALSIATVMQVKLQPSVK
ncbi:group III truncated hemoglobin [Flavobacterium sp. J372]|uniref:group III truncated hemoglobin n=1 Tax=Flavobacterium sp. J372 TaxID=2898436 RepID=UPI002150C248|nr:group III truncated hemoglobin [Flavobacterium sp. J372]MCR5863289.1 group III truncated hemoglobin [Flavobacterium sp. J372]